jgi:trehalose 6-phosphate phosphatase
MSDSGGGRELSQVEKVSQIRHQNLARTVTASNLFYSKGLVEFARYVSPDTLFAFDLDGTLAPIVADNSKARVDEAVRNTLRRLVKLANVTVITGRSRKDALAMLGFEPQLVIGNHGAELHEDHRSWSFVENCLVWRHQLHDALFYEPGIEIELKGESIALHYRNTEDHENALSMIQAALDKLAPVPRVIMDKYVVNLLPMEAFTKGEALVAAMGELEAKRVIYFGDDITVLTLKGVDVFGIHIGAKDPTTMAFYLNSQSEMLGLLNSMVGILESQLMRSPAFNSSTMD